MRTTVALDHLHKERPQRTDATMTTVLAPVNPIDIAAERLSMSISSGSIGASRSVFASEQQERASSFGDGDNEVQQSSGESFHVRLSKRLPGIKLLGDGAEGISAVKNIDETADEDTESQSDEDSVSSSSLVRRYHPLAGSFAGLAPHVRNSASRSWGGREDAGDEKKAEPQAAMSQGPAEGRDEIIVSPKRNLHVKQPKFFPLSIGKSDSAVHTIPGQPSRNSQKETAPVVQRRIIFPTLHGTSIKEESKSRQVATIHGGQGDGQAKSHRSHRRSNSLDHSLTPHVSTRRKLPIINALSLSLPRKLPSHKMLSDEELLNALDFSVGAKPEMKTKTHSKAKKVVVSLPSRPSPYASLVIPPFKGGSSPGGGITPEGLGRSSVPKHRRKSYLKSSSTPVRFQQTPSTQPRPLSVAKPLRSILRTAKSSPVDFAEVESRNGLRWRTTDDIIPHAPPLSKLPRISSEHSEREESFRQLNKIPSDLSEAQSSCLSLRRISSENNMASTQEKERRRSITGSPIDDKKAARKYTRHSSMENCQSKCITFDPRIWVVEYERALAEESNWFTQAEMERFKFEAIARIQRRQAHQSHQLIPSGTGRIIGARNHMAAPVARALFSDPALGIGSEEDEGHKSESTPSSSPTKPLSDDKLIKKVMLSNVRNVLIVDPHDMFLKLFTKAIRSMMDHVIVTTARSAEEAIRRISAAQVVFPQSEGGATHGFDIIIVEERLKLFHHHSSAREGGRGEIRSAQAAGDNQNQRDVPASGSALINQIATEQRNMLSSMTPKSVRGGSRPCFSLLVGVSAHLSVDQGNLRRSGSDFVWGKPPPPMGEKLRNELLRAILAKRGKPMNFVFD